MAPEHDLWRIGKSLKARCILKCYTAIKSHFWRIRLVKVLMAQCGMKGFQDTKKYIQVASKFLLCSKGIVKPAWNTLLLLMYVCLFLLKMWITMLLYSSVFHFGDNDINGIYFYSCYLNKGKYRERKFSLCDAEINPLNKHRGD